MSTKVKVVLHQGHLKLRFTRDRKSYYQSLGLGKLPQKYWNDKKQQVRSSHSDHKRLNTAIQTEFARALSSLPRQEPRHHYTSKPLLTFMEEYIATSYELRSSTLTKYRTIHAKLGTYLKEAGKERLTPNQFDISHVKAFFAYLIKSGMTLNTSIHYHRIIRKTINLYKKVKQDNSHSDPFLLFKYPKKESHEKPYLRESEIYTLTNTIMNDNVLENTRLKFTFQFYAGGMRVSDLMLLRHENLIGGRIKYNMLKSPKPLDHIMSEQLIRIIGRYLQMLPPDSKTPHYLNILENLRISHTPQLSAEDRANIPLSIFIPVAPVQIHHYTILIAPEMNLSQIHNEIFICNKFINNQGLVQFNNNRNYNMSEYFKTHSRFIIDNKNELEAIYSQINGSYLNSIKERLTSLGSSPMTKNNFVFDFLQGNDFPKNRRSFTDEHYKLMHHKKVVYNRQLKRLQEKLRIPVNMTSHLARTAFTNIALNEVTSTSDIMGILGHSSLAITDAYVRSGFSSKSKDDALSKIGKI